MTISTARATFRSNRIRLTLGSARDSANRRKKLLQHVVQHLTPCSHRVCFALAGHTAWGARTFKRNLPMTCENMASRRTWFRRFLTGVQLMTHCSNRGNQQWSTVATSLAAGDRAKRIRFVSCSRLSFSLVIAVLLEQTNKLPCQQINPNISAPTAA
jgi:hypothetical protein